MTIGEEAEQRSGDHAQRQDPRRPEGPGELRPTADAASAARAAGVGAAASTIAVLCSMRSSHAAEPVLERRPKLAVATVKDG